MMQEKLRFCSGTWIALCGVARAATFLAMIVRFPGVALSGDTQLMCNPLIRWGIIFTVLATPIIYLLWKSLGGSQ